LHGATNPCGPGPPHYRGFTITHSETHCTQYDFSGRVISRTQKALPDDTQHPQQTDILAPAGLQRAIPASELLQTRTVDSAATVIGQVLKIISNIYRKSKNSYISRFFWIFFDLECTFVTQTV